MSLQLKMQQLEYEHEARQRSQRMGTAQAREARVRTLQHQARAGQGIEEQCVWVPAPPQGIEERMALYRQQLEEQAKADVARQVTLSLHYSCSLTLAAPGAAPPPRQVLHRHPQVERIREVEVSSVRLEEAAKWRRALEGVRVAARRRNALLASFAVVHTHRPRHVCMCACTGERQELERLHSERLAKLRGREEEVGEKLRRQQVRPSGPAAQL